MDDLNAVVTDVTHHLPDGLQGCYGAKREHRKMENRHASVEQILGSQSIRPKAPNMRCKPATLQVESSLYQLSFRATDTQFAHHSGWRV
jgi:hypothetical protein